MESEGFDETTEPEAPSDDDAQYINGPNSRVHRRSTVSHRPAPAETRAEAALGLLERPEWHEWAACRGMADFFDLAPDVQAERCAVCPVFDECQTAGLKEPYGMWSGELKPGLEPVADELADRIVDLVTTRPYRYTTKGLETHVRGTAARIRNTIKRLTAEGSITQYVTQGGAGHGSAWTILYGPAEVRK